MGTGSFALEAMEAAGRSGAEHITLVSRPRQRYAYRPVLPISRCRCPAARRPPPAAAAAAILCGLYFACLQSLISSLCPGSFALPAPVLACRWVLPFSRQFTISVWNFMPLLPWPIKIRLVMVSPRCACCACCPGPSR